jgi:C4-dicarboxylate-specific signal transduction histidine kinase
MYKNEAVVVADIHNDPLMKPYLFLIEPYGFHGCWSSPISINQGTVLGTFAMYYQEVRRPVPRELELMSVATHIAGIAIDRTRNEEELRRYQLELEELVKERTTQLLAEKNKAETAAIALIKANQDLTAAFNTLNLAQEDLVKNKKLAALGSLIAGVAHELNTPIGNCVMASSTLAEETEVLCEHFSNNEGVKRTALMHYLKDVTVAGDILTRNLERVTSLVESFKRVAVDQTTSNRRKFKLSEVINEVMGLIKGNFNKKPFVLEEHIPDDLELDSYPGSISQILECVVENAQVHAFDGRDSGKIIISANSDQKGWINLLIQDDGAGISSQHIDKIFDPFFTTRMGSGSMGLGLNIAHNVVVGILGGKIAINSKPQHGTLVTITLPVVAPHLQNPVS